jgi:hypothetical protein
MPLNWETTITVPVALIGLMALLIAFPILAIFRGWIVVRPFYVAEVNARLEEKKAKDDALEANKSLMEANTLLLRRDDLSITTLKEIRDYIHRDDPETGGGHP